MAIKERDVVLVSTNESNDTIIDMPVTRENCVEGLGRIRGTAYSVGDVVLCAGSMSLQLICTVAGTTSTDELDITGNAAGDSIVDGTVTWIVAKRNYFNNSGVLPISEGGTGATTASDACANIGALPTTGGTITGALYTAYGIISRNIETDALTLFGGVDETSAYLQVFGKNHATLANVFFIACDSTLGLFGSKNGELKWGNKNLHYQGTLNYAGRFYVGLNVSNVAPSNGMLYCKIYHGSGVAQMKVYIDGIEFSVDCNDYSSDTIMIPIYEGATYRWTSNASDSWVQFIPCK